MTEPILTVDGRGYRVEVSDTGLLIERLEADEDCRLFVPIAEIPDIGVVVERAYREGVANRMWPDEEVPA